MYSGFKGEVSVAHVLEIEENSNLKVHYGKWPSIGS